MRQVQCDKCKATFKATYYNYCEDAVTIKISVGSPNKNAELHLCKACFEKLDFHNLVSKAEKEPEPLLEALREIVREEIEEVVVDRESL